MNYDLPNGAPVEHMVMNPYEWHHYTPTSLEDGPSRSSVMKMETRLEKFAIAADLSADVMLHGDYRSYVEHTTKSLERDLREKLSHMGLLIPDSMTFEEDIDNSSPERRFRIILRANALMPTFKEPVEKLPPAQRRYPCEYCGTNAFEDTFHSGTCENCGGRFNVQSFR